MSSVELISLTPDAEKTMAYIARVSNPSNQKNEDYSKLLSYCIKNEHWSVFEQSFMTLQIETNRGIAAQILRHRSFTFQELKKLKIMRLIHVVMDNFYQSKDFDTMGKLCLKIDLQLWAIELCSA